MNGHPAIQANRVSKPVKARDCNSTRPEPATVSRVLILDPHLCEDLVRQRQERDIDKYDEVWEGVYVVSPGATNPHQDLVQFFCVILFNVITLERRGRILPGANVSDRREGWDHNFRGPDVVAVLEGSRAVDCITHWYGGPDFLVEIQSPNDDTDSKIPFYSKIQVRELLIVHRDTRHIRLYRHNGQELVAVQPVVMQGSKWFRSEVLPLAFRRRMQHGKPVTEVRRTDGTHGNWTM